jgi:formylglycine-generating enzyme required for sulfatase activity
MMFISQGGYGQKKLAFTVNGVTFEMIFVEGGTFTMGCVSESNCTPAHNVTLNDFFIGKFQVTQKLWQTIMGGDVRKQWLVNATADREWMNANMGPYARPISATFDLPGLFSPEDFSKIILNDVGDNYPMFFINYCESEKFCCILNHLLANQLPEGYKFVIPTEAQWEYAARGGNVTRGYTFSGSNNVEEVAWHDAKYYVTSYEVGKKTSNELGIYDMSGNVWEWCLDWFDEEYYTYSPSYNPTGPIYGEHRILRGGSWRSVKEVCRVSWRYKDSPEIRASNYGLRLALVNVKNIK